MPSKELRRLFTYNPEGYLVARTNSGRWVPGKPVGHKYHNGYLVLRYRKQPYYVHHLIWRLLKGRLPKGLCIDHIDGNPLNNKIENLRLVTRVDNQKNQKRRSDNTSGITGVRWCSYYTLWNASLSSCGKKINLGYFHSKQEAAFARHIGDILFGFHPNHGRVITSS